MSKFTPLPGKILVKPDEQEGEKTSAGGIIIPDTVHKAPVSSGRVRAVGEGSSIPVDSRVVYSPYSGYSMSIGEVLHLILGEHEILGYFEGDERVLVR
jgi:co-chaperonin GroES (HSP10)